MIPNVCTVLKFHLVISAQISFYSLVPQLTWDCVVDFEADPAFLALALATWVFLTWIWKTQKISEKPLTCDWILIPRFWTHFLRQCINLEVLYTFQHATTPGTNFDSSWTCIFIVSVQGSTKTKTRKVGKKSILRVGNLWKPLVWAPSSSFIAVRVILDQYRVGCVAGSLHFVTWSCDILCIVTNWIIFWNCRRTLLKSWDYIALDYSYWCQLVHRCWKKWAWELSTVD